MNFLKKRQRKSKVQSRMNNPETQATLSTRQRAKSKKKKLDNPENSKDEQHGTHTHKKPEVNTFAR